jgi:hypothetical protein
MSTEATRDRDTGEIKATITGYTDKSPLEHPRACAPLARVKVGWFRRCRKPGNHLHEHCRICGLRWLTAFAEGT